MIVVFFGSFYLINLVLAVVALSYEQEAENIANRVSRDIHFLTPVTRYIVVCSLISQSDQSCKHWIFTKASEYLIHRLIWMIPVVSLQANTF